MAITCRHSTGRKHSTVLHACYLCTPCGQQRICTAFLHTYSTAHITIATHWTRRQPRRPKADTCILCTAGVCTVYWEGCWNRMTDCPYPLCNATLGTTLSRCVHSVVPSVVQPTWSTLACMTHAAFLSLGVACRLMMARLPPALTVRRGRLAAGMICRLVPRQIDTSCNTAHQTCRCLHKHDDVSCLPQLQCYRAGHGCTQYWRLWGVAANVKNSAAHMQPSTQASLLHAAVRTCSCSRPLAADASHSLLLMHAALWP